MHFRISGSTAGLRKYAKKLREVGSDTTLRHLSDNLAEEALDLIAEGFATETDPDGNKWKDKVFPDGRQILVGNTTRLRRGWHRKYIAATGFILAPSVNYAKHQQEGTGLYGPHHHKIVPKEKKCLAFYAHGYVTKAAANRVRYSAAAGYRGKAGQSVQSRMSAMKRAGNRAVSQMKGSTVLYRSVKGAPPRRMIPSGKKLPAKWQRRMQACAHEFFTAYFAKK